MPNHIKISLGEVQETLMIPLFARAQETEKNGLLTDHKALEIVQKVDYDFHKLKNKPSLKGAVLRTLCYDHLLKGLLRKHPDATVVELGCGLNTRYERINNDQIRWYDLDMPDVYALWKHFFKETGQRFFLPFSAFDDSWVSQVKRANDAPVIFLSEASTIYFGDTENKKLLSLMMEHFPNSYYIFDTATDYFIQRQDKHDALRFYTARIKWRVNDVSQLEQWDNRLKCLQELNFFTNPPENLKKRIPWYMRLLMKIMAVVNKKAANQYQLNVFAISP